MLVRWTVPLKIFCLATFGSIASADVRLVDWYGTSALLLEGEIVPGTADQLISLIEQADVQPHDHPILLLDSIGGSVAEALAISAILGTYRVHTIIPNGARCASACGSVVFIAGALRTVEPFGLLGQHSCSRNGIPDESCNELLANHAVRNGVSYGSIAAFVTYVPPSEILWFSRQDADGWGLTRYAGSETSGFEKSEPRAIQMLTGNKPGAQSAWRIDIRESGYEAFLRPFSDDERELELNLFCYESLPGRLFLSMEIHGPSDAVQLAITSVTVSADSVSWLDNSPIIGQMDDLVTEVVTEIPSSDIIEFLTKSDALTFRADVVESYQPMTANTYLAASRENLIFAANNCVR